MSTSKDYYTILSTEVGGISSLENRLDSLKHISSVKLAHKDELIEELKDKYERLLREKDSIIETLKLTNQQLIEILSNNNKIKKEFRLND